MSFEYSVGYKFKDGLDVQRCFQTNSGYKESSASLFEIKIRRANLYFKLRRILSHTLCIAFNKQKTNNFIYQIYEYQQNYFK